MVGHYILSAEFYITSLITFVNCHWPDLSSYYRLIKTQSYCVEYVLYIPHL
jgi:hypothetical protein